MHTWTYQKSHSHQGQEVLAALVGDNKSTEASVLCLAPTKEGRSKDNMFPIPPRMLGFGGREGGGGQDLANMLEKSHRLEASPTDGDTGYFLPKAVNTSRLIWSQVRSFPQ